MPDVEKFNNNNLEIIIEENPSNLEIFWIGKSTDRMPSNFLNPIFKQIFTRSSTANKKLVMDFTKLEYMNSSTIMSISKFIEQGKNQDYHLTVLYNKKRRWQELSFSALRIFQTKDKRINFVEGKINE